MHGAGCVGSNGVLGLEHQEKGPPDSMEMPRLFLVDDDPAVVTFVSRCLEGTTLALVGTAPGPEEADRDIAESLPDLVLMDIALTADRDGIALAGSIWTSYRIPIVYVSGSSDIDTVTSAAGPGVLGYLVKPFDRAQLLATIAVALSRARHTGHEFDDERLRRLESQVRDLTDVVRKLASLAEGPLAGLAGSGAMSPEAVVACTALSVREREVLARLMDNHRVPAIADSLFISQHTVRNHLKAIFRKFGVGDQQALIDFVRVGHSAASGPPP